MEYVDGGNLHDFLHDREHSTVAWSVRLNIAFGVVSALAYIHNFKAKKSYCHGDIKPENVLLTKTMQVKLADFGSARLIHATGASSTTTTSVGKPQYTLIYVAPELLDDDSPDQNPMMDMYR